MLTLIEKIIFILLVLASGYLAFISFGRMLKVIGRGQGSLHLDDLPKRLLIGAGTLLTQRPVYKTRRVSGLFHAGIALAFIFYLLVDLTDLLGGYFAGVQHFMSSDAMGWYRLIADLLSVAALIGMIYFLVRRFVTNSPVLTYHQNVTLHPNAAAGIRRDSLIVGLFILLHVGFRFLGETFWVAAEGQADQWQPFASLVANLWAGLGQGGQLIGWHVAWWMALGSIMAFVPYFPYTKHIHLMVGPFNL